MSERAPHIHVTTDQCGVPRALEAPSLPNHVRRLRESCCWHLGPNFSATGIRRCCHHSGETKQSIQQLYQQTGRWPDCRKFGGSS